MDFFVINDKVESLPPIKEFFGPFMSTLSGEQYASDENGSFLS